MSRLRPAQPEPASGIRGILCPYCGHISSNPKRCDRCGGHFDPLSRQATQNAMGPWFIRDLTNPTRPGCSFETLRELIKRGKVTRDTVLRGPTTRQFWNFAARTPSVANLLGLCHNCHAEVSPDAYACQSCGAVFSPETDRQHMGLAPVHLLPGQAAPEIIAAASIAGQEPADPEPVLPAPVPSQRRRDGVSQVAPAAEERQGSGTLIIVAVAIIFLGIAAAIILYVAKPWKTEPAAPPTTKAPSQKPAPAATPAPAQTQSPAQPAGNGPAEEPAPAPAPAPASEDPKPPAPAPSNPQPSAPKPPVAGLLPLLLKDPPDEAGAQAMLAGMSPPDAELWGGLLRRRVALSRLRRLP